MCKCKKPRLIAGAFIFHFIIYLTSFFVFRVFFAGIAILFKCNSVRIVLLVLDRYVVLVLTGCARKVYFFSHFLTPIFR